MGEVPTTTNTAVQTLDSIIHGAIMSAALTATQAALEVEFPFLDLPLIHNVFEFGMRELFEKIDEITEKIAAFQLIDAQTNAEAKAYQASVGKLQDAIQKGDQNAIDQAQLYFEAAFGNLIHTDGS